MRIAGYSSVSVDSPGIIEAPRSLYSVSMWLTAEKHLIKAGMWSARRLGPTVDHALKAWTIKTTETASGCCSGARLPASLLWIWNSFQTSSTAFVKNRSWNPTMLAGWQDNSAAAPAGEKCGLLWKHAEEEVWRVQNKSPSTNKRRRVTSRMWVSQSNSTSHEPFMAISWLSVQP